jgi:serine phosphatase RsbU (regulator of sigma subunit)/integral membrane sensor domain MASE1/anti-sigma regulatory factor (Ser/Thr protein kinase)
MRRRLERDLRSLATDHRLALPSAGTLIRVLLVAAAYYLTARLSLRLALVERNVTPLWPPTGIAVVALLVYGRAVWPGIAVSAFLVNLPVSTSALAAATTAVGNTLAPVVASILLLRAGFRTQFDRLRDAVSIVFVAALGSMLISATIGTLTLVASGLVPRTDFFPSWAVWWTGDAMGVLMVAPFLLTLPRLVGPEESVGQRMERVGVLLVVAVVSVAAFRVEQPVQFIVLPLLGWAAWRFQEKAAAPAALVVGAIAASAAAGSQGPFAGDSLSAKMLILQSFNATVAMTCLFFAAVVRDRIRARLALERAALGLEGKVRERTMELIAANEQVKREVVERREAERQLQQRDRELADERRIAETLQRSFLPETLPQIPGLALAARYLPAGAGLEVGGDWYDVVQLGNGMVGLAIGDVTGHGLRAASIMGQLRMAVRAYAMEEASPATVVERTNRLLQLVAPSELATLVFAVFDPETGGVTLTNAGHPPPLLVEPPGEGRFLEGGLAPPLGAASPGTRFGEIHAELAGGVTLLLFTDGLVERREVPLPNGLERLRSEAGVAGIDVAELCDRLLVTLVGEDASDDVALLAVRPVPFGIEPVRLRVPADPYVLASLRRTMRRWFREIGVPGRSAEEILVASGEACANAIQHAYGARRGSVELGLARRGQMVEVTVRDEGTWRAASGEVGGRGLHLMRGLMDTVEVDASEQGTEVRMRRHLTGAAMP